MACRAKVVLPEDSGPYISIILHLAYHHHKASSKDILPDEKVATFVNFLSPSFIIDHTQNCFSIIERAAFKASFLLSVIFKSYIIIYT
jgi:hypothetical protein